jgi:putative DNA primase/helicase
MTQFQEGAEDYQQAEWLTLLLDRTWKHDFTTGLWHHFEGHRWVPDQRNALMFEVASLAARALNPRDVIYAASETERKARTKLLSTPSQKRAIEALATFPDYGTDGNEWDTDPYLLGCENGVLDLRLNEVRPGKPEDLITRTTGHVFTPIATLDDARRVAPRFMEVLTEWTSGDVALADFLLDWYGSTMFGINPEQRFLIETGRGRNGKGALKYAVLHALGPDYAAEPDGAMYMRSPYGAARSDQARIDLVKLKGVRATFFSDPPGKKFNEEMLKAHTGGDRITARALHSNNVQSWDPTHSITFLLNDAPELDDLGPSMAGRIMVADFREDYTLHPDKNLYGSPRAAFDREAAGILAILAQAAKGWYDSWAAGGGLVIPERVVEQVEDLRGIGPEL